MKHWVAPAAAVFFLLTTGCQVKPTRTRETVERPFSLIIHKAEKPLVLTERTILLDTRSTLDYGLNRVENSQHFTLDSLPLNDLRRASLRLSLFGISPETPVVVIGSGSSGQGEEGALAWRLTYLGVMDVQTATMRPFRKNWTRADSPPVKNVPVWQVPVRSQMSLDKDEFKKLVFNQKMRVQRRIFVIDVRSEKEYFNKVKALSKPTPDIQALHIEWKEFFNDDGRPNWVIRKKLNGLEIGRDDRVILISNHGVRSAAAAYALIALGFTHVQNFAPGWQGLLD